MGSLFKVPEQVREGARLDTLLLPKSQYGNPIIPGYGTMRLGAQTIWGLPLREERVEHVSGGKKGRVRNIDYNYYGTFAVSFGQGVASYTDPDPARRPQRTNPHKVFANGDLIYDNTLGVAQRVPFNFDFYPGTSFQPIDKTIEAAFVDANGRQLPVPAYRGQVYMVVRDLLLAEFGNRLPEISAEITFGGDPDDRTIGRTGSGIGYFPPQDVRAQYRRGYEDRAKGEVLAVHPPRITVEWAPYRDEIAWLVSVVQANDDADPNTVRPGTGTRVVEARYQAGAPEVGRHLGTVLACFVKGIYADPDNPGMELESAWSAPVFAR